MYIDPILYDIFFKEYKLESGDIAFSLGAGVGEEIAYMSERVGENGKVFAIEADPNIFKELEANVSKYKNVIALNIALTDFIGSVYVVDAGGIGNYIQTEQVDNSSLVACTTMDQLVADYNINKIDYIKVNIEGSEFKFLNGFKENYHIVKKWCVSCHDFMNIEEQRTLESVKSFFAERNIDCRQYDSEYIFAKFYIYADVL